MYSSLLLEFSSPSKINIKVTPELIDTLHELKRDEIDTRHLVDASFKSVFIDQSTSDQLVSRLSGISEEIKDHWKNLAMGAGLTLAVFGAIYYFLKRRSNKLNVALGGFEHSAMLAKAAVNKQLSSYHNLNDVFFNKHPDLKNGLGDLGQFTSRQGLIDAANQLFLNKQISSSALRDLTNTVKDINMDDNTLLAWRDQITKSSNIDSDFAIQREPLDKKIESTELWSKRLNVIICVVVASIFFIIFSKYMKNLVVTEGNQYMQNFMAKIFHTIGHTIPNFWINLLNKSFIHTFVIACGIAFIGAIFFAYRKYQAMMIDAEALDGGIKEYWVKMMKSGAKTLGVTWLGAGCAAIVLLPIINEANKNA